MYAYSLGRRIVQPMETHMNLLKIKTGAMAAVMGLGVLAAPAAVNSASAEEIVTYSSRTVVRVSDDYDRRDREIYLERRGGEDVPVILDDNGRDSPPRRDDRRHVRGGVTIEYGTPGYEYERRHLRRQCTTDRALDKAENLGLRRVRVVHAGERTIKIRGRKDGERVTVRFSRAPGCPIREIYY